MMEITGELHNVLVMTKDNIPVVAWGYVHRDIRDRFFDGQYIRTSYIESIDGDLITTRNSVYKVIGEMTYKEYTTNES